MEELKIPRDTLPVMEKGGEREISMLKQIIRENKIFRIPLRLYRRNVLSRRAMASVPKEARVHLHEGREFVLRARGWETANFLIGKVNNGYLNYEPAETIAFKELLGEAVCVFDLGAHIGYYSLLASLFPNVQTVVAFETLDKFVNEIKFHAAQNKVDNISVVPLPVGIEGKDVSFENFTDHSNKKAISLDKWCSDNDIYPDVIKMDIEGNEYDGLMGAKDLLTQKKPSLLVEIHPKKLPEFGHQGTDVLDLLNSFGYEVSLIAEEGLLEPLIREPETTYAIIAKPKTRKAEQG